MTLGEKLAKLRKENNITQEQLADSLGVSRQSVSKWENDIAFPETDKLIAICRLFDCSSDYLLLDAPERSSAQPQPVQPAVINTSGRIFIRTHDNQLVSCLSVDISPVLAPGKNEPSFALNGVDRVTFWGRHNVTLGWYRSEEDIRQEIDEITQAISRGEPSYELKYCAKVEIRAFSIKLAD